MIPFHERAKNLFLALKTTPNKFAVEHGFNGASMYNLINPDRKPGLDMLERICAVEPRISAEYLLRGQGEPLRDQQQALLVGTAEELESMKAEVVATFDRRIQELRG